MRIYHAVCVEPPVTPSRSNVLPVDHSETHSCSSTVTSNASTKGIQTDNRDYLSLCLWEQRNVNTTFS